MEFPRVDPTPAAKRSRVDATARGQTGGSNGQRGQAHGCQDNNADVACAQDGEDPGLRLGTNSGSTLDQEFAPGTLGSTGLTRPGRGASMAGIGPQGAPSSALPSAAAPVIF